MLSWLCFLFSCLQVHHIPQRLHHASLLSPGASPTDYISASTACLPKVGCRISVLGSFRKHCSTSLDAWCESSQIFDLRPPKGLGINGGLRRSHLIGLVQKLQCGVAHMPLSAIVIGDRMCTLYYSTWGGGGQWATTVPSRAYECDDCSFGVTNWTNWEKSWTIERVAFAHFDECGCFSQVELAIWADLWCPQFAFLMWSHFQERTAYIWICELKLLVCNFQVVASLAVTMLIFYPHTGRGATWI